MIDWSDMAIGAGDKTGLVSVEGNRRDCAIGDEELSSRSPFQADYLK